MWSPLKRRWESLIKRAGLLPLLREHGQVPHRNRQVDRRDRHLQFHRALRGPHAGAFLLGHVEDFVDQPLAGLLVLFGENMAGDLHQIAIEFTLVPQCVGFTHFIVVHAQTSFHQVVGLGEKLHHPVFDAVVDHLHEVTGRTGTEPGHARIAVHPGRDSFQHRTDALVSLLRPAGHDARSVTRTFFSTRHARRRGIGCPSPPGCGRARPCL